MNETSASNLALKTTISGNPEKQETREPVSAFSEVGNVSTIGLPATAKAAAISISDFKALTEKSLLPVGVASPVARILVAEYLAERQALVETSSQIFSEAFAGRHNSALWENGPDGTYGYRNDATGHSYDD